MMSKIEFSKKTANLIAKYIRSNESKKSFLKRIIKTEKLADEFLDCIIKNPRNNKKDLLAIKDVFETSKDFFNWFDCEKGYNYTYNRYMGKLWVKAKKIEDVLKYLPNLTPWCVEQKFGDVEIGNVPTEFVSNDVFISIIQDIINSDVVKKYKNIKFLEGNLEEFKKKYPEVANVDMNDFGQKKDFLSKLLEEYCAEEFVIKKAEKSFKCKFLCNPFSAKMVFKIITENGKKYILKSLSFERDSSTSDRTRKIRENDSIRADSPYSNALMEFYLKLNNSVNAPSIHYYNHFYSSSLYELEEGEEFNFNGKPAQLRQFAEFNHKILPDSCKLGIYVNDICSGNFIVSKTDKKVKIIDIGHATYANPLNPGLAGVCFSFTNLCGRDFLNHFGVLAYA